MVVMAPFKIPDHPNKQLSKAQQHQDASDPTSPAAPLDPKHGPQTKLALRLMTAIAFHSRSGVRDVGDCAGLILSEWEYQCDGSTLAEHNTIGVGGYNILLLHWLKITKVDQPMTPLSPKTSSWYNASMVLLST